MKPKLEQLSYPANDRSFICYEVIAPAFELFWHYHPEYELTYIVSGKGKRLIGDGYDHFEAGDFVLLPPSLSHTWTSETKETENCRAIVIQFSKAFLEQLFQFSALSTLDALFEKASRGLKFIVPKKEDLLLLLERMLQVNEVMRLSILLQLFDQLSVIQSEPVASIQYKPLKGSENQQRINTVFQYVQKEFSDDISLKKAAALIHLSESAFCKFFKRASGKTFSDYTHEIRIAHACHLLIETDQSISSIAFAAGFESLTYFNRIFLKKKLLRPGAYRKLYRRT